MPYSALMVPISTLLKARRSAMPYWTITSKSNMPAECGACSTCHVIVKKGYDSLSEMSEKEEDMLDRAWGLTAESRLSCQAKVGDEDLTVEIPKYTINLVSER